MDSAERTVVVVDKGSEVLILLEGPILSESPMDQSSARIGEANGLAAGMELERALEESGVRAKAIGVADGIGVSVLKVQNGDVVVFELPKGAEYEESYAQRLAGSLAEMGLEDILLLAMEAGTTIQSLDCEAMRKAGWMRCDEARKLGAKLDGEN